ncbi:hypothetical protein AHIS2_p015 [Acaryochloris phage A-HIS2]|nr:hypothetical protein AHIS2_p015 [Acaryochloris phage A-HIS2]
MYNEKFLTKFLFWMSLGYHVVSSAGITFMWWILVHDLRVPSLIWCSCLPLAYWLSFGGTDEKS